MKERQRITSIRFLNYKAFEEYSISLDDFNVLVGPNNAGKSTVLGAIRILSEGIRRARAKSPSVVHGPKGYQRRGYPINLEGLPVSTENVFHNYDESSPAVVEFRLSNAAMLTLYFPERGACYLVPDSEGAIRTPSDFRREFDFDVSFVPVLGPVEHNEPLYRREAARDALLSHRASRNFRNIWHHFGEGFEEFRKTIRSTWPGMDIEKPELAHGDGKPILYMFCPEERFPREIFWAGFGFQVWCQLLTFMLQAKNSALLVIDEPDIYLHSDLQRQLVGLLRDLGPQIIIATHSAEIISEVAPRSLLNINKRFSAAKRIKDTRELQEIFSILGSNLNPILTQLVKTRRVVFVEGKDFQIVARFARRLGLEQVANRSDFAVVPANGFNPQKVKDFAAGMEATLGSKLIKVAIFDRDYRSDGQITKITADLEKFCAHAIVHKRKELENFLLHPNAIERAVKRRIAERKRTNPSARDFDEPIEELLMRISAKMKNEVQSRLVESRKAFERTVHPQHDAITIAEAAMNQFDQEWGQLESRMQIVPGKDLFSALNGYLQTEYQINLTAHAIVDEFTRDEVWPELVGLLKTLDSIRTQSPPDGRDGD